ncbi:hypothetical protein [Dactylosporangium sp. CA-233914]|uniref:hypothetical protein n=1 Tax=Dactylosporangium sp. CA-233914 TaxID=3239934 RepID=UPI003D8ADFA2
MRTDIGTPDSWQRVAGKVTRPASGQVVAPSAAHRLAGQASPSHEGPVPSSRSPASRTTPLHSCVDTVA